MIGLVRAVTLCATLAFGLATATASIAGSLLIIIQPVEPSIGRDFIELGRLAVQADQRAGRGLDGPGAAADAIAGFEEDNAASGFGKSAGGGEPGDACSNDGDVGVSIRHECVLTLFLF